MVPHFEHVAEDRLSAVMSLLSAADGGVRDAFRLIYVLCDVFFLIYIYTHRKKH